MLRMSTSVCVLRNLYIYAISPARVNVPLNFPLSLQIHRTKFFFTCGRDFLEN